MTDNLQAALESALSKLYNRFHDDPESLHETIALVFSSIFRKFGIQCTIVGGQSAAYWMRIPGSTDVDFVSPNSKELAEALELCGFVKTDNFHFRYKHPSTNVLIELVHDRMFINSVEKIDTVEIQPKDIDDPIVQALMPGTAEILDPVCVFLNYVEASNDESIWFDYKDQGALAIERALALLSLYGSIIIPELKELRKNGFIDERLVKILNEKFQIRF